MHWESLGKHRCSLRVKGSSESGCGWPEHRVDGKEEFLASLSPGSCRDQISSAVTCFEPSTVLVTN